VKIKFGSTNAEDIKQYKAFFHNVNAYDAFLRHFSTNAQNAAAVRMLVECFNPDTVIQYGTGMHPQHEVAKMITHAVRREIFGAVDGVIKTVASGTVYVNSDAVGLATEVFTSYLNARTTSRPSSSSGGKKESYVDMYSHAISIAGVANANLPSVNLRTKGGNISQLANTYVYGDLTDADRTELEALFVAGGVDLEEEKNKIAAIKAAKASGGKGAQSMMTDHWFKFFWLLRELGVTRSDYHTAMIELTLMRGVWMGHGNKKNLRNLLGRNGIQMEGVVFTGLVDNRFRRWAELINKYPARTALHTGNIYLSKPGAMNALMKGVIVPYIVSKKSLQSLSKLNLPLGCWEWCRENMFSKGNQAGFLKVSDILNAEEEINRKRDLDNVGGKTKLGHLIVTGLKVHENAMGASGAVESIRIMGSAQA